MNDVSMVEKRASIRVWKGERPSSTFEAAKTLSKYGFKQIAKVGLTGSQFSISLSDETAGDWICSIYAFVINDEIVRVGSSKGELRSRLRNWEKHVTASLNGDHRATPKEEAELWRAELSIHQFGGVWAREGTRFATPISDQPISGYQDEESELIARHMPRLNRGKHR